MTTKFRLLAASGALVAGAVLMANLAFAQGNSGDTKPGWGFGDDNHVHTGPPGQSVHPGDNDDNDQGENGDDQGENNHGNSGNHDD